MADARKTMKPKFTFSRLDDQVLIRRDNGPCLKM